MFKEYGELATILYELTKPAGHSINGDIEYFLRNLEGIPGPVLEAGVGTGRMLVPLLRQGLAVDGVDISDEMLSRCKLNMEKHGVSAELYLQDLTALSLPKKYGAIIMPTGSFCLIPAYRAKEVLTSFANHLLPGGKLIVDIIFPTDFKKGETFYKTYPLRDSTGILYTNSHVEIDWFQQKTSHIIKYELLSGGEIQKTEVSNFTLYWHGVREFDALLESIGFVDICHELNYGAGGDPNIVTFMAVAPK